MIGAACISSFDCLDTHTLINYDLVCAKILNLICGMQAISPVFFSKIGSPKGRDV